MKLDEKLNKIKDLTRRLEEYKKFIEMLVKYDDGCQPLKLVNGYDFNNSVYITLYPKENEQFRQLFDMQRIKIENELKDILGGKYE